MTKTIYDPSPAGYCLPSASAFSGFTTTGDATDNLQEVRADLDRGFVRGGWFYTDDSRMETIFFPTQGNRNATEGRLYGVEEIAYAFYWTAGQGYFPYYGYSFYFYAYGDSRDGYAYMDPRYCYHVSCGYPVRPVRRLPRRSVTMVANVSRGA